MTQETITALLITSQFLSSHKAICIEWIEQKHGFAVVAIESVKYGRKRQMKTAERIIGQQRRGVNLLQFVLKPGVGFELGHLHVAMPTVGSWEQPQG